MKLGKIVVHMDSYHSTMFHQNQKKNKKVLIIYHLTEVLSVKFLLRLGEFGLGMNLKISNLELPEP